MITTELTKKEMLVESLNELDFSNEPLFAQELRAKAQEALAGMEFPTSKTEYWKYTRLGKIINKSYGIQKEIAETTVAISDYLIPEMDANVVVLVNGFYNEKLSQITPQKGIKIHALRAAMKNEDAFVKDHLGAIEKAEKELFVALNTCSFTDGVYVDVEKGVVVEKPIHIINIVSNNNSIVNSRTIVKAHDNCAVKMVESFVNLQGEESFTNNVAEFFLNPNAHVEYNKIQDKKGESYHISTDQAYQRKASNFTINTITLDGTLVRNNLNIEIDAEGCETNLSGIYLGQAKNHIDNHTIVDHLKPNCVSNEVYKGILDDNSVGVFNGKVFVRPDAQKTNAFQQNNNILLTDGAVMNSKPELEIYADDVKCSHGSTIGQLDEEAIFYLKARGVSQQSAINMMVMAFTQDALEEVSIEALKNYIKHRIEARFKS